jgi:hypothetical protein
VARIWHYLRRAHQADADANVHIVLIGEAFTREPALNELPGALDGCVWRGRLHTAADGFVAAVLGCTDQRFHQQYRALALHFKTSDCLTKRTPGTDTEV